jgi:hypothetical protein
VRCSVPRTPPGQLARAGGGHRTLILNLHKYERQRIFRRENVNRHAEAWPYAEAAAQTWAGWDMKCAQNCAEGWGKILCGDKAKAAFALRRVSKADHSQVYATSLAAAADLADATDVRDAKRYWLMVADGKNINVW